MSTRKRKNRSLSTSVSTNQLLDTPDSKLGETLDKIKEIPDYLSKKNAARSGFDDYRGFLNLCLVLMVVSNARVFLENLLSYGILVDPLQWVGAILHNPYQWPNLLLVLGSNVFVIIALNVQSLVAKNQISVNVGVFLHSVNLLMVICVPPVQTLQLEPNPVASIFSCSFYVIVFLKLWSFAQTNNWYHDDYSLNLSKKKLLKRTMSMPAAPRFRNKDEKLNGDEPNAQVPYPYNLTYRNIFYFMLAPTLCYETSYPRNKSINKVYLGKRIVEMLFLIQLELALVQQWIVPTLQKAIPRIHNHEGYRVFERLLRLSIPNHLIWLIFFYCFFHSVLNVIAELTRFADREFYRDWWNSESVVYFWKAWNIPVHKFCVRHIYKPLIHRGCSKQISQLVVFLFSAFFHEYLMTIPLQLIQFWAFFGMLMQVPLSMLTAWVRGRFSGQWGNVCVWISLIIGQPMGILAYVYFYYVKHYASDVTDHV